MSSFDFTIFCLTVIALVAIVHHRDEITIKSLAVMETVVSTLSGATQRLKRHFKEARKPERTKKPSRDQKRVHKANDTPTVHLPSRNRPTRRADKATHLAE